MTAPSRFVDDLNVPVKVLRRPSSDADDTKEAASSSSGVMLTAASSPGGDAVPWRKTQNHADCPSDRPWAVVKNGTDEVEGCHATEDAADKQLAALYASEKDMAT